jgi:hypothetical protein
MQSTAALPRGYTSLFPTDNVELVIDSFETAVEKYTVEHSPLSIVHQL